MDGWPSRWRSLTVVSLAGAGVAWLIEKVVYQFDPRRNY